MALTSKPQETRSTRRSLLARLPNWEDNDSWEAFARQYTPLIRAIGARVGLTSAQIDEVVQATMITMAKKFKDGFQYDPARSFRGYLSRTVASKIKDLFRSNNDLLVRPRTRTNGGERRTATIERVPDPNSLDLDKICHDEWKRSVFERAIENVKSQVKDKHFQIYDLLVLKELPVNKVAAMVGVNRGQVYLIKYRVARRVDAEKERLEKEPF